MKRKVLWILLPILAVGAIAAAIVLLPGRGAGEPPVQRQIQQSEAPVLEPMETLAPAPAATATPAVLPEEPEAAETPKFEVSAEGQSSPTEEPVYSGGEWNNPTPEPQTPIYPGGDEDELPLIP